jgi:hypothetical protein
VFLAPEASLTIEGCEILRNLAASAGGGLYSGGDVIARGTTLARNRTAGNGGGAFLAQGSTASFENCTLAHNVGGIEGGAVYDPGGAITEMINVIVWGNGDSPLAGVLPAVIYSDVQGGWPGEGNVDKQPLFRDPGANDYRLRSVACGWDEESPVIDAGRPELLDAAVDCGHGLGGVRSDMGAYGGGGGDACDLRFALDPGPIPAEPGARPS